jgi:hypothetical protein
MPYAFKLKDCSTTCTRQFHLGAEASVRKIKPEPLTYWRAASSSWPDFISRLRLPGHNALLVYDLGLFAARSLHDVIPALCSNLILATNCVAVNVGGCAHG